MMEKCQIPLMNFYILPFFPMTLTHLEIFLTLAITSASRLSDTKPIRLSKLEVTEWLRKRNTSHGLHLRANCLANGINRSAMDWSRKRRSGGEDLAKNHRNAPVTSRCRDSAPSAQDQTHFLLQPFLFFFAFLFFLLLLLKVINGDDTALRLTPFLQGYGLSRIKWHFVEKIKQGLIRVWITRSGHDILGTFLKIFSSGHRVRRLKKRSSLESSAVTLFTATARSRRRNVLRKTDYFRCFLLREYGLS